MTVCSENRHHCGHTASQEHLYDVIRIPQHDPGKGRYGWGTGDRGATGYRLSGIYVAVEGLVRRDHDQPTYSAVKCCAARD